MYFSNTGASLPKKPTKNPKVAISPEFAKNDAVPPAETYTAEKSTNIMSPISPYSIAGSMACSISLVLAF